ncbi:MAG: 4'-phosphopantetheinyl transferase superfamily protein [Cyanobacteria bacterium J06633_2]
MLNSSDDRHVFRRLPEDGSDDPTKGKGIADAVGQVGADYAVNGHQLTIEKRFGRFPELNDTDVHLWQVILSCGIDQQQTYYATLSSDERARADRFKFEHLRHRFIIGRGVLRELLGRYLAIAPGEIRFTYGRYGKPTLDQAVHSTSISFNLSHSNTMALLVFCRKGMIGVDVEHIRSSVDALALSKRFFTPHEYHHICSCASEQAIAEFFRLWTCKEAYLKATGEGLAGLQTIEVDVKGDAEPSVRVHQRSINTQPHRSYAWNLAQCQPSPNYVGAIALGVEQQQHSLLSLSPTLNRLQQFVYLQL